MGSARDCPLEPIGAVMYPAGSFQIHDQIRMVRVAGSFMRVAYTAARCPRSVTCAPRVRPSAITAATRWSRPSAASIRTSSGSASTTAGHRDACTSARAASKPARSPKPAEWPDGGRSPGERPIRLGSPIPASCASVRWSRRDWPRWRPAVRRSTTSTCSPSPTGTPATTWCSRCAPCSHELDRLSDASEGRTIDEIGRDEIVASVARAALLGARGNSGVILSQLIRGAAEELISRPGELVDPVLIGAALARAADQAYGSVRDPAEGTILTVVREMAHRVASEIAHIPDARLGADATAGEQDIAIAERDRERAGGRRGVGQARPRPAAGAARGGRRGRRRLRPDGAAGGDRRRAARQRGAGRSSTTRRPGDPSPARLDDVSLLHQLRGHRARAWSSAATSGELEQLGDSVLVVGDQTTLKVHVHTDDPDAATALFADAGVVSHLDVADMREQVQRRDERLEAPAHAGGVRRPGRGQRRGDGGPVRRLRPARARRRPDAQPLHL